MGGFFDFLLALITFRWLGDRQDTREYNKIVDTSMILLGTMQGDCLGCDDTVYYDALSYQWKHLSTRQVASAGADGKHIAALLYIPPEEPEVKPERAPRADEDVLTVGKGPKPVATESETEIITALRALDYTLVEARAAARDILADPTVGPTLEGRVLAILRKRVH